MPVVDPGQGPLGLRQELAGVVGEGQLMLALERLRAHVGLVIPGVADRVTEPGGDVRLGPLDVGAQLRGLGGQLVAHLGQLGFGPAPLPLPHRKRGSA